MSFEQPAERRPRLLVFAGPNGSGKTTVTKGLPIVGIYVNADDIKRISACSDLEAAQEAEKIRHILLEGKQDFTFETVLSTDRNLELLKRAKEAGYEIHAVFVLTCSSDINVRRVQERVRSGGHDVPEDKVRSRYARSLENLAKLVRIADRTRVIDNSGAEPALICEVIGTSVRIFETENWTKKAILSLLYQESTE